MINYVTSMKKWELKETNSEEWYEALRRKKSSLVNEVVEALNREFENLDSILNPKKQVEQFKKIAEPLNPEDIEWL